LLAFVALYVGYCLYWGITSARASRSTDDYFLAGRQTPAWVFILTGTALSITGWVFLGHPSMVYLNGLQFAQLAVAAVIIPLAGILFLKRQWMLARRFGYATPGEMLSDYFSGEAIRVLVVLIAVVFAVPFVGMQLLASGHLIAGLTGDLVDADAATWVLSFAVFLYVCLGGLRAVTFVGALQGLLIVAGLIALGSIAYIEMGGFGALNRALAGLAAADHDAGWRYMAIPGVIQFTAGLGKEAPQGGPWTASMILTYGLALAGLQAAPAFSMLGFSCRTVRGFAWQQVWAVGTVVGIVLLFFVTAQGMAAHFLGASKGVSDAGLASAAVLPAQGGDHIGPTIGYLLSITRQHPWFTALLAVAALAALHVAAAAYTSTTATIVTTDVYKRFVHPSVTDGGQKLCARVALAAIFLVALLMATFRPATQAELGALALAFAFQLWPALAGACWFPWITRQGATLGLVAGLSAVVLTEPLGGSITGFLGLQLPWGRWPWTIHSAGWGIACNVAVCLFVSLVTRGGEARQHRWGFHRFLEAHAGLAERKRAMRPAIWALALTWLFFAIGPGAIIGNDFFGLPYGGLAAWYLGIPSLWAWQIIWWALGVLVIWWLAYKMELATPPRVAVEAGQRALAGAVRSEKRTPLWIRNFLRRVT
jgi:Na+/proline symporter